MKNPIKEFRKTRLARKNLNDMALESFIKAGKVLDEGFEVVDL